MRGRYIVFLLAISAAGTLPLPGDEALAAEKTRRRPVARSLSPGLRAFGTVAWQGDVLVGPGQNVCVGDQFFGPGSSVQFGLVTGKFGDRLYFRTERKIIREWEIPNRGQPDSAIAWANRFLAQFADHDTLFAELHDTGEPVVVTGTRAVRMANLFRRWVQDAFTSADWAEAAELGIPPERLTGPPPERICAIGVG